MKQDNIVSIWLGNFMKKIILIFFSLLCISCSSLDAYVDKEARNKLITKGAMKLMTEEEKQNLYLGGTDSFILYTEPFSGIFGQTIRAVANNLPHQKKIEEAAAYIYKYQNKIIISDNTNAIQEAIEYMGKSKNGRKTLLNCRFVFLNYADRDKIAKLSKQYGFKYSYPKLDE